MIVLESLIQTPLAKGLGWTLFHSLWEGAIAAILLVITMSLARSPRIRYAAACLAMLGILAGFAITLFRFMPEGFATTTTVIRNIPHAFQGEQRFPQLSGRRIAEVLPWLTPFWFAGVVLFHLRGVASWMSARRLRRKGVCPAPDGWQQRLDRLAARLRVAAPVGLLETVCSQTPVVIGWLRPVVLFPVGLLAGMPAGQIEAILLHELAHIHRRDYLANLLQTVVEGFLFYHPAVWWISSVIRTERENCCDDLVVAVQGNAHEYATALTALEENRWAENQAVLAVASLSATGGVLMKRIRRLLYPKESQRALLAPVLSAGLLVAVTAMALTAWQSKPAGDAAGDFFHKWLNEEVPYIITDAERNTFNQLQSNSEREIFIEQFWARRNPAPGAVENAFKAEHYRRIGYANEHFGSKAGTPGWKTDRGRIYITFGPPDEIDSHPVASAAKPPYEDWRYRFIEGIGSGVNMEFDDTELNGEFHMTRDPNAGEGRRITKP
jgi:GWxTD domain-containing protein